VEKQIMLQGQVPHTPSWVSPETAHGPPLEQHHLPHDPSTDPLARWVCAGRCCSGSRRCPPCRAATAWSPSRAWVLLRTHTPPHTTSSGLTATRRPWRTTSRCTRCRRRTPTRTAAAPATTTSTACCHASRGRCRRGRCWTPPAPLARLCAGRTRACPPTSRRRACLAPPTAPLRASPSAPTTKTASLRPCLRPRPASPAAQPCPLRRPRGWQRLRLRLRLSRCATPHQPSRLPSPTHPPPLPPPINPGTKMQTRTLTFPSSPRHHACCCQQPPGRTNPHR
jgi:hypothetical protein